MNLWTKAVFFAVGMYLCFIFAILLHDQWNNSADLIVDPPSARGTIKELQENYQDLYIRMLEKPNTAEREVSYEF